MLSFANEIAKYINTTDVPLYHGVYKGQLTVIHRLDGETWKAGEVDFFISDPNFKFDFESGASLDLAPVLGSQNNVIVIQGGRLINFDLEKQAIGWEISKEEEEAEADEEGEGFSGQPSLAEGIMAEGIIFAVYEGELRALDEIDGSFIDELKPWSPDDERIAGPMIVTENLIFVSTASTTYAIDLNNDDQPIQWSCPAGGQLALSDTGLLLIATTDGRLIAIDLLNN